MIEIRTLHRMGLASLVLGGFLILSYVALAYSVVWRGEVLPVLPRQPLRPGMQLDPAAELLSPYAVLWLAIGGVFIANGLILLRYTKSQEAKQTKDFVISTMLTEEEKQAFAALKEKNGIMTQKELSSCLGFSPVKAHRVLLRLEQKKVVKSFPFGMTKKIILEKMDA